VNEAEILIAIAATPDDDAPRLAYATLLAERDAERAELIRAQCEQARSGNTPELQARIGRLLDEHQWQWAAQAGIVDARVVFHRGFPKTLIGTCAAIVHSRDALRTQPIVSLSLLAPYDPIGGLVALPELARIVELTVAAVLGSYGKKLAVPR
jgi:uncharacterized protein (TIGR02996 family)